MDKEESSQADQAHEEQSPGPYHVEQGYQQNNVNVHMPLPQPVLEPAITFADLGIPKTASLDEGISGGKVRKFADIPLLEKTYVLAMIGAICVLMFFTIYRISKVDDTDPDFIFGLVLIVNSVFCLFYVVDSVKRERPSELFILSLATILMVIYLIVNYIFGEQNNVKLARMVIGLVLSIPLVIFGIKTSYEYYSSKSLIFRTVGANSQLQTLLQRLYFFQDLLKFDLELGVSIVILVITSRLSLETKDIIILSVGGAITIALFFFGYFSFQREYKVAIIFFPMSIPEIGYIIYKMYDVSHYIESKSGLAGATIACATAAIVVRVLVLIMGIVVYRGFGEGLKEKLVSNNQK